MKINGITYSSKTTCVDIDTGEEITLEYAKKHYKLIKTKKEITHGKFKEHRIVQFTRLYRNRQQLELW